MNLSFWFQLSTSVEKCLLWLILRNIVSLTLLNTLLMMQYISSYREGQQAKD